MSFKDTAESGLRGAFCAVWLVAFILAFCSFVSAAAENNEAGMWRTLEYACVGVIAAGVHAYLITRSIKNV
jgi:hypothetical protein